MAMTRSENMQRIKSKNTKIEVMLRKELWKRGLRYRIAPKNVMGKPDIVFKSKKTAIFCDSEFWHGKDYKEGKVPKSNREFWIKKLERNIKRDEEVNRELRKRGWKVFRFWGKEIEKNLKKCADMIEEYIKDKEF